MSPIQVKACAAVALRKMNRYPLADNVLMGLSNPASGEVADEDAATVAPR